MDAAVIDRIRGYADDGMAPARIASTLGITEADVRLHLVGVPMRAPSKADVGPLVGLPVTTPLPVALQNPPTAKQREIWRLVHDEGLTRVEAAKRLGIPAPTVRNQLMAYMRHMGMKGDIPGMAPQRGFVKGSRPSSGGEQGPVASPVGAPLLPIDPPPAEMPSGRALLTMLARLDREIVATDEARIELEAKVGRLRIAREVLAGLA